MRDEREGVVREGAVARDEREGVVRDEKGRGTGGAISISSRTDRAGFPIEIPRSGDGGDRIVIEPPALGPGVRVRRWRVVCGSELRRGGGGWWMGLRAVLPSIEIRGGRSGVTVSEEGNGEGDL